MLKKGRFFFTTAFAKASGVKKVSKGRLVVFEGIDGSGKTTICKLLLNYLKKQRIACAHYSFPRYDEPWGKMVRRYLDGEFGDVDEVNPYLASVLYAGDRAAALEEIRKDLAQGKIVVCDRYVASNVAHQMVKIKDQKLKIKYKEWMEEFEYISNKIPREDLVILLSVTPSISQRMMSKKKKDIHERNKSYLENVWQVFEDLAKSKNYWEKVDCVGGGKLRKPEEIQGEVLEILKLRKII